MFSTLLLKKTYKLQFSNLSNNLDISEPNGTSMFEQLKFKSASPAFGFRQFGSFVPCIQSTSLQLGRGQTSALSTKSSFFCQVFRPLSSSPHNSRSQVNGNGPSSVEIRDDGDFCVKEDVEFVQNDPESQNQNQNPNAQGDSASVMKVLNVAEKNDAAKRIAGLLSGGAAQTRNTFSKFNKWYDFPYNFQGQNCEMKFTSVSGHLLTFEFGDQYRKWHSCDPVELFDAPVYKSCPENYKDILKTLEAAAPQCNVLVIWTDCDREGEGICYEIIDVCKAKNPRLTVYRAKFSEMTPTAVNRAWRNLEQPNKRLADAVNVRSELDLRIGAAFTRFQTLRLCKRFPNLLTDRLISYGSCQFPTLGFVVERYKAIQSFIPEDFWKIEVSHKVDDCHVDFNWARVRLFNKLAVQVLYEKCLDNPEATVTKVASKSKSKWRPVALDTVEFEKLSSRKLRINAKEAMRIAEKLYTQGIISYPRTETNIFPQGLDLAPLVDAQCQSQHWGGFAQRLLAAGPNPRNGKNTDQAHPPIHPTKFVALNGDEGRIFELIARHFLACCSKDALGMETTVDIEIAEEKFVGHGLRILERNYLEVYPYDKWTDKELPDFQQGQKFRPTRIEMVGSQTSPPNLLTEADLISLMEKHGIGTDATHAEHIETIKQRMYVGVQGDGKFVPGQLGMGLVEGYDAMGFEMSKPYLRSGLEADLKGICEGRKDPKQVLHEQVQNYKQVFIQAADQVSRLDAAVGRFLNADVSAGPPANGPAPRFPGAGGGGYSRRGGGGPPRDDDDGDDGPPPPGRASTTTTSRGNSTRTTNNNSNRGTNNRTPAATRAPTRNIPTVPPTQSQARPPALKRCECGNIPPQKKVTANTKNQGRFFQQCSDCGFFDWCDGLGNNYNPPNNSNSNSANNITVNSSGYGTSLETSPYNNNTRRPPPQSQTPARPTLNNSSNSYGGNGTGRSRHISSSSGDENASEIPKCGCGIPAVSLTVRKEGANKGRLFFGCPKGMSAPDKCSFFQWDDERIGARTQARTPARRGGAAAQGGFSSNRGARGGGYTSSRVAKPKGGPRKCGICKEVGHTRRNCPLGVNMDDEDEDGFFDH